jgi:hypothetical protein
MAIELKVTEAAPAGPDALEFLLKSKRREVTRLAYQRDLRLFFRVFARSEPTPQTIGAFFKLNTPGVVRAMLTFKMQQIEQGVAEVTLNRRLTAIRSLLSVARQLGLTEVNPQGLVPGEKTMQYRDTRGVDKDAAAAMLLLPDTSMLKGNRSAASLSVSSGENRAHLGGANMYHWTALCADAGTGANQPAAGVFGHVPCQVRGDHGCEHPARRAIISGKEPHPADFSSGTQTDRGGSAQIRGYRNRFGRPA